MNGLRSWRNCSCAKDLVDEPLLRFVFGSFKIFFFSSLFLISVQNEFIDVRPTWIFWCPSEMSFFYVRPKWIFWCPSEMSVLMSVQNEFVDVRPTWIFWCPSETIGKNAPLVGSTRKGFTALEAKNHDLQWENHDFPCQCERALKRPMGASVAHEWSKFVDWYKKRRCL